MEKTIAQKLAEKVMKSLDFNAQQMGADFPEILESLAVMVGCAIHNNARGDSRDPVIESFKEAVSNVLEMLKNDSATPEMFAQ